MERIEVIIGMYLNLTNRHV